MSLSNTPPYSGSAFPVSDPHSAVPATAAEMMQMARGMSLRDYFAAHAMQPLIRTVQHNGKTGPDAGDEDFVWVARRAYLQADAMLAARKA